MLSRQEQCRAAGVPVTNYGLAIAHSLGIFERALGPFPAALATYREWKGGANAEGGRTRKYESIEPLQGNVGSP